MRVVAVNFFQIIGLKWKRCIQGTDLTLCVWLMVKLSSTSGFCSQLGSATGTSRDATAWSCEAGTWMHQPNTLVAWRGFSCELTRSMELKCGRLLWTSQSRCEPVVRVIEMAETAALGPRTYGIQLLILNTFVSSEVASRWLFVCIVRCFCLIEEAMVCLDDS